MLKITIVDSAAESRNRIAAKINRLLDAKTSGREYVPSMRVKPLASQELKFHETPDICIIGKELVASDLTEIGTIGRLLKNVPIIVEVDHRTDSLTILEEIVRFGVEDVIREDSTEHSLLRKLIVHGRKRSPEKQGKLLSVVAGKGGVGATSIAAALGEAYVAEGVSVCLVDLDFESQDLSRFLQIRPFANENLDMILERLRPVSPQTVEECLSPVWCDDSSFVCMPPPVHSGLASGADRSSTRILMSVFETLDSMFDIVIIDVGSARGYVRELCFRAADAIRLIISNDPASLYASVARVKEVFQYASREVDLQVVLNAPKKHGIQKALLRQEFGRAAGLEPNNWSESVVPECVQAGRWPGSGNSIYSQGSQKISKALKSIVAQDLCSGSGMSRFYESTSLVQQFLASVRNLFTTFVIKKADEIDGQRDAQNSCLDSSQMLPMPCTDPDRVSSGESSEYREVLEIDPSMFVRTVEAI